MDVPKFAFQPTDLIQRHFLTLYDLVNVRYDATFKTVEGVRHVDISVIKELKSGMVNGATSVAQTVGEERSACQLDQSV